MAPQILIILLLKNYKHNSCFSMKKEGRTADLSALRARRELCYPTGFSMQPFHASSVPFFKVF